MVKAMSGGKKSDKKVIWRRKNWKRLNQMLDEGIRGEFEESNYDESELSKIEVKWKRFLQDSAMAKQNLESEKANIKGLISDISHQTKTPMANITVNCFRNIWKKTVCKRNCWNRFRHRHRNWNF